VKLYLSPGITLCKNTIKTDDWISENDESPKIEKIGKIFSKHLGSINSDSNLLLEFLTTSEVSLNEIPFQFQISYTRVEDGKRLMRVISRLAPISKSRKQSEEMADPEVLGLNAMRSVAQTAQAGNYTAARLQNYTYLQLMKRVAKESPESEEAKDVLKNYSAHNRKLEYTLYKEQLKEINEGKEWDETVEEIKEIKKELPPSKTESFFSGITSFFGKFLPISTSSSAPVSETVVSPGVIQQQRTTRTDDVSNLLWNMRGANM